MRKILHKNLFFSVKKNFAKILVLLFVFSCAAQESQPVEYPYCYPQNQPMYYYPSPRQYYSYPPQNNYYPPNYSGSQNIGNPYSRGYQDYDYYYVPPTYNSVWSQDDYWQKQNQKGSTNPIDTK